MNYTPNPESNYLEPSFYLKQALTHYKNYTEIRGDDSAITAIIFDHVQTAGFKRRFAIGQALVFIFNDKIFFSTTPYGAEELLNLIFKINGFDDEYFRKAEVIISAPDSRCKVDIVSRTGMENILLHIITIINRCNYSPGVKEALRGICKAAFNYAFET
jgi:hypothetical protein